MFLIFSVVCSHFLFPNIFLAFSYYCCSCFTGDVAVGAAVPLLGFCCSTLLLLLAEFASHFLLLRFLSPPLLFSDYRFLSLSVSLPPFLFAFLCFHHYLFRFRLFHSTVFCFYHLLFHFHFHPSVFSFFFHQYPLHFPHYISRKVNRNDIVMTVIHSRRYSR